MKLCHRYACIGKNIIYIELSILCVVSGICRRVGLGMYSLWISGNDCNLLWLKSKANTDGARLESGRPVSEAILIA